MPRRPRLASALIAAAALLGSAACSAAPSSTAPTRTELTVYAAASLQGALEEIVPAYSRAAPGMTVTVSRGASSALRTQIEQGASADLFLSADTRQATALVESGLSAGNPRIFTTTELTIIKPVDATEVMEPADLARSGVKIVAAGESVPITRYATRVVANLGKLNGFPAGFAEAYAANVVSREDDVRAVVAKIELGEGDAAIVYRTDALAVDAVARMEIPEAANVEARYAGVVIGSSAHGAEAVAFLDWLVGSEGQEILASYGFSPPP